MDSIITREKLLSIAESDQIAFQFCDGLITFTALDGDEEAEFGADEITEMKRVLENATDIMIINPSENLLSESLLGFKELIEWSQADDTLILVDNELMLCISKAA